MENNPTILVTGGAGFIGSHFVELLLEQTNYLVLVVDNFSQGRENVMQHPRLRYAELDLRDKEALRKVFADTEPSVAVHFAAMATITASVTGPEPTYEHNIFGSMNLISCMKEFGVKKIIYSSSGSVYGEAQTPQLREDHPKNPLNPYGFTKWFFERVLQDYHAPYGIDSISFRYFNPAGCSQRYVVGEHHKPETHVIPLLVETLLGNREKFYVFGNDFSTPDGTGIRDYIYVVDLVTAHLKGLQKLLSADGLCTAYNLGTNIGTSVLELITAAERVSGKKVPYEIAPRRPGDPSKHVADASKAMDELEWHPSGTIDTMIQTCYESFKKR